MIRFLLLLLMAVALFWLIRRVLSVLYAGATLAPGSASLEGLVRVCREVSELVDEAAEGLAAARFDTLFVRFEDGVVRLKGELSQGSSGDGSWRELNSSVLKELDGVRDQLYGYHAAFSEQQAALARGDDAAARRFTTALQGRLEALRRLSRLWQNRSEEALKRLQRG